MKTFCIALLVAMSFLSAGCASSDSKYFGISRGDVPTPEQWVGLYGIVLAASSIVVAAYQEWPEETVTVGYVGTYGIPDAALGLVSFGLGAIPPGSTVTADHTPVPHDGSFTASMSSRIDNGMRNWEHILNIYTYHFMGVNTDQPPYDQWLPTTLSRNNSTIMRTVDLWLLNYDWDDPYVN